MEYMNRLIIKEKIRVPPDLLNRDVKKNIMSILRSKEGTCTKDGCIVKIVECDEIGEANIYCYDSNVYFHVEYTCDVFKPENTNTYQGMIFKSYEDGILADIEGCQMVRILCPACKHKNTGDRVSIRIDNVVLSNGSYIGTGIIVS